MAQYDGSIRINTQINTKQAQVNLSTLENRIVKTSDKIATLQSRLKKLKADKNPTEEYAKLESELLKSLETIENLEGKQKQLSIGLKGLSVEQLQEQAKSAWREFDKVGEKLDSLDAVFADLKNKRNELLKENPEGIFPDLDAEYNKTLVQYEKLQEERRQIQHTISEINEAIRFPQEIEKAKNSAEQLEQKMISLEEAGKAFTFGNPEEISKTADQLKYAENELSTLNQKHEVLELKLKKEQGNYKQLGNVSADELKKIGKNIKKHVISAFQTLQKVMKNIFTGIGKVSKSVFSGIGKSTKKSEGLLSTLGSRFKGLALSLLIFNQISKAFNAMISGMKEGFTNLYNDKGIPAFKNSVDSLKASILTLKNSFAAAFRPIVEIAIPYIQKLIDYMIQLMNVVGQFMAAITGQKKYTKAIKQTTAAIEDQNKAQKKQLSNLDNLNNLTSDAGTSADVGGGIMFEEAPIESGFKNIADKVKDVLSRFFEPLKKAWNSQGKSVMKAWKNAINEIGKLAKSVGSDFLEVWQQQKTVEIFKDILHIIEDIGLAIGHLAENFRKAWEENNTGLHILENIRDIIGVIIANVKHAADATVVWAANLNFTPLLEAFERFTESLIPVIDALSGILTDFYEQVLLPLGKWTLEKGLPELLDVFTAFNEKVDWQALRDNLSEFWEHLEPFAETVGEGLILFIERVSDLVADFLNSETFVNFLHDLEDWMDSVTPEDVADGIEKLIKALVGLKVAIIGLTALKGLAEFTILMANFGKAIGTIGEALSGSSIAGTLSSLGGLEGLLTMDLSTIMGAGTASEIGLAIGGQIIAGIIGAFAGGISAKLIDNYLLGPLFSLFDEELGNAYKNFSWFGENGFFDTVFSDLETSLLGFKDMIVDFENDPVFHGLADMLIGPWANAAITIPSHTEEISSGLENLKNFFTDGTWKDALKLWKDDIQSAFESIKENASKTWSDIKESVSTKWTEIKGNLSETWTSIKTTASEKWDSIKSSISDTVDKIKEKIDSFIKKIKDAIQSVKDFFASGVNNIGSKVSGLFGGNGGKTSTFSMNTANIPYTANPTIAALNSAPIPKLATGAVIPANKEFLAVLGDQKHGTNIEAPLSTIEEAVINAMAKVNANSANNGGGKVTIEIPVIIKGIGEIGRAVQQFDTEFFKQNGKHAFT